MKHQGAKIWFTAAELAEHRLPGLPRTKRGVNERAADERWALATDADGRPLARRREARGGGLEYHIRALPEAARAELIARGVSLAADRREQPEGERSQIWNWFDQQSAKTKREAARRLKVVEAVDALCAAGLARSTAVAETARGGKASASTIWSWLKLVDGVEHCDRLPCLAPRRRGGGKTAEIDAELWAYFKSDYLRPEEPTLASVYRRTAELAEERGLSMPCERTFQRKVERDIDPRLIIARRKGAEALRRSMPAQKRSVAHLHALELVNIDGHKFDVFVRNAEGKVLRPVMVAIQDIYSRKIVAWRVGETESAALTRLTFADLFRDTGIPRECVLDNGRGFASKWITGGAKNRFRFKIKDDEPTGLLTALEVQIHWALPYRGQSKPIERAFRDLCDTVAKHPAMAGAYTGNRPDAKPENYGERAVPMDLFRELVAKGIAAHNARGGRRTETARGRSFDQVFAESYATAPIKKATEEQLRLALLAAEQLNVDRRTGEIRFHGNRYWCEALSAHHGQPVTVRFDPDNLHQPLHVYDQAGRYLTSADLIADTGFLDVDAAKRRARQEAALRKAVRAAEDMEELLDAEALAAMLPDHPDESELPEPQVVRAVKVAATAGTRARRQSDHDDRMDRFTSAVANLRLVE